MSKTDFLKTKKSREKLQIALEILREYKSKESQGDWLNTPFEHWIEFELLEEYLEHLVEGKALKEDPIMTPADLQRDQEKNIRQETIKILAEIDSGTRKPPEDPQGKAIFKSVTNIMRASLEKSVGKSL